MSNARVQAQWAEDQGIDPDQTLFNLEDLGNCGAASLGLVLDDALSSAVEPGEHVALMSVGTGLQYGGAVYVHA